MKMKTEFKVGQTIALMEGSAVRKYEVYAVGMLGIYYGPAESLDRSADGKYLLYQDIQKFTIYDRKKK